MIPIFMLQKISRYILYHKVRKMKSREVKKIEKNKFFYRSSHNFRKEKIKVTKRKIKLQINSKIPFLEKYLKNLLTSAGNGCIMIP